MTTIVVTETEIAYDSQVTTSNQRHRCAFEKVQARKGRIYAFAGDASLFEACMGWYERGAKPKKAPKGDWHLAVVTARGMWWYTYESRHGVKVAAPLTLGSGADFAAGALEHGATAREAVAVAAKRDIYTGYEINVINIRESLAAQKKGAASG